MKWLIFLFLCSCQAPKIEQDKIIVSIKDQKLIYGEKSYPVSTSKFGIGDEIGSNKTPLGLAVVKEKIGEGMPIDTNFKNRKPVKKGRRIDGIKSRIFRLVGLEQTNKNIFKRNLYVHGTPFELDIGKPASFGCIRMLGADIVELCSKIKVGTLIEIK